MAANDPLRSPTWPTKSAGAQAALYRTLQDIDIYVEDEGSEGFYAGLIDALIPHEIKLLKVFPCGGRSNVLRRASGHDCETRPALFIIDGDFAWVRGDPPPALDCVHRLDAYCVENLLVSEISAAEFLRDCNASTLPDAISELAFEDWSREASCFVGLFIAWTALNLLEEEVPTVGNGVGAFLSQRDGIQMIDPQKVSLAERETRQRVEKAPDGMRILAEVEARVKALPRPLDVVSGKSFLIPALELHIRSLTKEKCTRKSFLFRLARHADRDRFTPLIEALRTSVGNR